jgi:hypothetical protein
VVVGIAGALFVVLRRVMGPTGGALASAGILLVFAWFWFALPLLHRNGSAKRRRHARAHRRRSGLKGVL